MLSNKTEGVAQLVRASVCGTEGRGFETPHPPSLNLVNKKCLQGFSFKTQSLNPELLLIPAISAIMSWLFIRILILYFFRPYKPLRLVGINFQGIIPANQKAISASVAAALSKELLHTDMIRQKLAGPETLQKTMPAIEEHIDHFLTVKLKASLPVITMFIGERVTNQLKELFMKELEVLFPSVMNRFIDGLQNSNEIETEIALKIESIPVVVIEEAFYRKFEKELKKIEIFFAIGGFITGLIQVIILLALEHIK